MLRQTHIEDSFEIPLPSHSNTNKTFKGRETREELSMTRKIGRLVWLGYVFFIIMYVWNYEETPFNPQEFQETNPPIYVVPWIYDRTLGKWNLITNYPPEIIPKSKLTSEDEISIVNYESNRLDFFFFNFSFFIRLVIIFGQTENQRKIFL